MKRFRVWNIVICRHPRLSGKQCGLTREKLKSALRRVAAISADSSQAGIAALPESLMLEMHWLIRQVKREVGQVRQPTLIVHPPNDDGASLRNLEYLQSNLRAFTHTVVLDDSYHIMT
jgi:carboxylesterase